MRTWSAASLASVLLLAACGDGASAEETWATATCQRAASYKKAMSAESVRVSRLPLDMTKREIYAELIPAKRQTSSFVVDLRAIALPDSARYSAAKDLRETFVTEVEFDYWEGELRKKLDQLPARPTAIAVFHVLEDMKDVMNGKAFDAIRIVRLAPFSGNKALQEAFRKADACRALHGSR